MFGFENKQYIGNIFGLDSGRYVFRKILSSLNTLALTAEKSYIFV